MTVQRCEACGAVLPEIDARTACPACGGLLELSHKWTGGGDAMRARLDERRTDPSGVWRFRELVVPTAREADIVSYPEGNTPLIAANALARWTGVEQLRFKHEGLNPTGSFKDRGMTVAVTQARRIGATGVICASTGNTSASLAAYAARAGLPAVVLVPAGHVAAGKLTQTLAFGARTLAVRADFDRCLALVREASDALGLYVVNSVNPFRLEGQKTIVFELLAQLGWEPPDWIALPAGNLGNTAAFGKALREARELGLISRMPRLAAVQAAGAAPFARAFREGFTRRHVVAAETVATAIRIGAPASWDRAVRAIRETDGVVAAVSDDAILEAKREIDRAGVGCEPASAAGVAGVRALVLEGVIARDANVVAVLTGHMLKDADAAAGGLEPVAVEPSIAAIEAVLSRSW